MSRGKVRVSFHEDITARKHVEEALKESEERYRTIFENTGTATIIIEEDTTISLANTEFEKLTGYSKEEVEGKKSWAEFVTEDGLERSKKYHSMRRADPNSAPKNYELKIMDRQGNVKTVYSTVGVIPGTTKSVASVVDITERKRMLEALGESERRYRLLAENVTDVIWTMDLTPRFTYFSPSIELLLGYSVEEAMALAIEQIVASKSSEVAMKVLAEELAIEREGTGDPSRSRLLELELNRKDGSTVWTEVKMTFLRDIGGKPMEILGVARDITDRKQVEDALRESEEKFRSLAEQSPNMIFINKKGRVIYANAKCEEVTGYKREEFYSPDFDFLTLIASECVEIVSSNFTRHMNGENFAPYEYTIITKEGKRIEAIINTKLIAYEGDRAILGTVTDITRLKVAERALRESEEKLETMLRSIGDNMSMMDKDLNILWANETAKNVFGHDIIGKKCYEAYHRRKKPCDSCVTVKAFQDGKVHHHETQVVRKDGRLIHFQSTVNVALKDEEGKPAAVIKISRDVTDYKRSEEALRRSEHEKDAILNSMLELVIYHDTDRRIVWANRVASESVGLTSEQLRGRHCYEIWHHRSRACVGCPVAKALKTGQPQQREMRTPDGRVWVVRSYPVRGANNKIEGAVEVVLEITEQKAAEEKLREYEARYAHLLDNMPDGVALTRDNRILRVNPSMAQMFGYSSSDKVEGLFLRDLATAGSKMNMRRQSGLRALGSQGKNRFVFQALRKNGTVFPAEITLTVDQAGNQPFILAIIRDVSEREENERIRRRLSEQILKAQEKERALIARELHDELGQALTGIKMDMAWIKGHAKGTDGAISERLEALGSLIDTTINTVRKMASDLRPSVLDRLGLTAAVEWYAAGFERRTGIECCIESESLDFKVDDNVSINAYRILQEALTNVARHSEASRVNVRVAHDKGYLALSVSDNGKGIPLEKLSGSESLGIASMRERAELLKGRLDIRRRRPKGTEVTAYFPLFPNRSKT